MGKRVELSPGGEEEMDVFWWTKGTLREELRPWVNARTNDPPELEYIQRKLFLVMSQVITEVL